MPGCRASTGEKQLICCTRQYLAVVTVAPAAAVAAAPPRDHLPALLQVFDLRNKLLAGTMQAPPPPPPSPPHCANISA